MAEFSSKVRKINTLENSLKQFDMQYLLKQLDISLELVRKNKITEKDHLDVLKSVDKNLLKLSLTHHPDKAISEKKSVREVTNAQDQQIALNAARTVLRALTKAFLEDIDIHYKYDFFAKMDISTLINEEEMDRQINNVLYKISVLSEVKRVNIVGGIRKFLQESRKSLRSFLDDDKDEFERHRDYALCHFHKCVEGYEALVTECELTVEECESENDGNTTEVIQEIADRSKKELTILQKLRRVAKRALGGTLEIFSIYEAADTYDYYLVSPFVLYINVMLMCTSVVNRKTGFWGKFERILCNPNTDIPPYFNEEPTLFLKAYHLASYLSNKTLYEREVEIIFQKKNLTTSTNNVIAEIKDVVKNIENFLSKEFDIDTYKEGKSNREQFTEKLFKLNKAMTDYKEVEKELQEKLNFCKEQTDEIRKECFQFSKKIQETEQECQENILYECMNTKCMNTSEEISRLAFSPNQKEVVEISDCSQNKTPEKAENESFNDARDDSTYIELVKVCEETVNNLLDGLTDCTQNITEIKEDQTSIDSQIDCSPVIKEEAGKKMEESYEPNKKINELLCYLQSQTPLKTTQQGNITGENLQNSSLTKLNHVKIADKTREKPYIYDTQSSNLCAFGQNITGNTNLRTKYENKNHEGRILIHLPTGSIFSRCPAEEIGEECEEQFQKMNLERTVESDEAMEEDGKGANSKEERNRDEDKNQLCEEHFGDSSADSRNATISANCTKTADKIKKIADLYDTQFTIYLQNDIENEK